MSDFIVDAPVIRLETVNSTNNYAASLLELTHPTEGTAILAQFQTLGRGQRGAMWQSETGKNLLLSIILYPDFMEAGAQFDLSRAISLAVFHAIMDTCENQEIRNVLKIKWPNDLYLAGKKLGGILIENSLKGKNIDSCVVGIGINVDQQHFGSLDAISISQITGRSGLTEVLFLNLRQRIQDYYFKLRKSGITEIRDEYEAYLFGKEEELPYQSGYQLIKAKVIKTMPEGGLILYGQGKQYGPFQPREIQLLQLS
jgi:BirA family biotin operon repressor/biotin-[acetyl-CoA-carboxylase] ligase